MKIYILQEKIDTNTYFDLYSTDSLEFGCKMLEAYRTKNSPRLFRLIEVIK